MNKLGMEMDAMKLASTTIEHLGETCKKYKEKTRTLKAKIVALEADLAVYKQQEFDRLKAELNALKAVPAQAPVANPDVGQIEIRARPKK